MKRWRYVLAGVAALGVLHWGLESLLLHGPVRQGPYFYQILVLAGINIILAVSLNLTNGITGQFSIGHAGFFAVGAYVAASVSYYCGPPPRERPPVLPHRRPGGFIAFSTVTPPPPPPPPACRAGPAS